jgi:hypothetical protein
MNPQSICILIAGSGLFREVVTAGTIAASG